MRVDERNTKGKVIRKKVLGRVKAYFFLLWPDMGGPIAVQTSIGVPFVSEHPKESFGPYKLFLNYK